MQKNSAKRLILKTFILIILVLAPFKTQKSFFSSIKNLVTKKPKQTYQTDPETQKVILESIHQTSAKKSASRTQGFIRVYKAILANQKVFKKKAKEKLNALEAIFLEIDKEVQFYQREIKKHKSLLEPITHLLNEAVKEKNFLTRYKYSAGISPEMVSVIDMVNKRIETLNELMPMEIPLKDIVNDIKYKWQDRVLAQIKEIVQILFDDMNLLNRVADFLKNDVKEIDLQGMVQPIMKPFIDFYGKRVVTEWGSALEELKDFQNKIWVPMDTYTMVYFSVRDSIIKTVINSVKPFVNSLRPTR